MAKFTVKYIVLHRNNHTDNNGYESTYFATHGAAFMYCEGLPVKAKAVYAVKSRDPMTVTPINVFGSDMFNGSHCPIFRMQQHFANAPHNYVFTV